MTEQQGKPRITFGIIVLNGEPFTEYCLRSVYAAAHQIIVVEGACEAAAAVATQDGHSVDGTLEALDRFKRSEDPNGKVEIVTRDGFWTEKDEMSQAYAERATGNYLWQVDVDEFYRSEDMETVVAWLRDDPGISGMSFRQLQFWGGFSSYMDSWRLRGGAQDFSRLFRWGPGYRYAQHRPPTVVTESGVDTKARHWIQASTTARKGIRLYHYSFVFPQQVREKCAYYAQRYPNLQHLRRWVGDVYEELKHPFRVDHIRTTPGWLEAFDGRHPEQIESLRAALAAGTVTTPQRPTDDIVQLLERRGYRWRRALLKFLAPVGRPIGRVGQFVQLLRHEPGAAVSKVTSRLFPWRRRR